MGREGLTHGSWDSYPLQLSVELEGESEDIDPGDLGDEDCIGEGEWSVQHSFGSGHDFFERREAGTYGV